MIIRVKKLVYEANKIIKQQLVHFERLDNKRYNVFGKNASLHFMQIRKLQ